MDCTYKTNKYRLPLITVVGTTAINTSFYVGFAFLRQERTEDYIWFLQQLKLWYQSNRRYFPRAIITDRDLGLMEAIGQTFPTPHTQSLLCIWHINMCVQAEFKPVFHDDDNPDQAYREFEAMWHAVIYADDLEKLDAAWDALNDSYGDEHPEQVTYLERTWLCPYKQKFIKYYTNQVLHFGNVITSRVERSHSTLKRQLGFSTGDLKTVVDNIDLLLKNQLQEYQIGIDEAKSRVPYHLRIPIFQDVIASISPFALRQILKQYH